MPKSPASRLPASRRAFRCRGLLVLLSSVGLLTIQGSASAKPYDCSVLVKRPLRFANGQRGDILLTRREGSPAGAVTDPLGQTYTHSGMLTDDAHVKHNTSVLTDSSALDTTLGAMASILISYGSMGSSHCYHFVSIPADDLRRGAPGLSTNSAAQLGSLAPWDTGYLRLLKPRDELDGRAKARLAATAIEGLKQAYDVRAYMDYEGTIPGGGSMCSGSVKRATDLAGVGGFNLRRYTASNVNISALSLYHYVYDRAHKKITEKDSFDTWFGTAHVLTWQCRGFMAAGVANHVVDCFATGQCNRGPVKGDNLSIQHWATGNLGVALSISPDDLINNQPQSNYQALVPTQIIPEVWEVEKRICNAGGAQVADYDGDGKTDMAIYRYGTPSPSDGEFVVLNSQSSSMSTLQWGTLNDIPLVGDYNGDGRTDYAVWRRGGASGTGTIFVYGRATRGGMGAGDDIPVAADYDGDKKTDFGYFRPSTGTWYFGKATGPLSSFQFGGPGDSPLTGDFEGVSGNDLVENDSLGTYNASTGSWNIGALFRIPRDPIGQMRLLAIRPGTLPANGIPVVGLYDHLHTNQVRRGVFKDGIWTILNYEGQTFEVQWGQRGDIPAPGDYDGDGFSDFAVWRPGNPAEFYVKTNPGSLGVSQTYMVNLGRTGDRPVIGWR